MTCKAKNVYYVALYKKFLLSPLSYCPFTFQHTLIYCLSNPSSEIAYQNHQWLHVTIPNCSLIWPIWPIWPCWLLSCEHWPLLASTTPLTPRLLPACQFSFKVSFAGPPCTNQSQAQFKAPFFILQSHYQGFLILLCAVDPFGIWWNLWTPENNFLKDKT